MTQRYARQFNDFINAEKCNHRLCSPAILQSPPRDGDEAPTEVPQIPASWPNQLMEPQAGLPGMSVASWPGAVVGAGTGPRPPPLAIPGSGGSDSAYSAMPIRGAAVPTPRPPGTDGSQYLQTVLPSNVPPYVGGASGSKVSLTVKHFGYVGPFSFRAKMAPHTYTRKQWPQGEEEAESTTERAAKPGISYKHKIIFKFTFEIPAVRPLHKLLLLPGFCLQMTKLHFLLCFLK